MSLFVFVAIRSDKYLTKVQTVVKQENTQQGSWATPAQDLRCFPIQVVPGATRCHQVPPGATRCLQVLGPLKLDIFLDDANFQVTERLRIWVYTTPGTSDFSFLPSNFQTVVTTFRKGLPMSHGHLSGHFKQWLGLHAQHEVCQSHRRTPLLNFYIDWAWALLKPNSIL